MEISIDRSSPMNSQCPFKCVSVKQNTSGNHHENVIFNRYYFHLTIFLIDNFVYAGLMRKWGCKTAIHFLQRHGVTCDTLLILSSKK